VSKIHQERPYNRYNRENLDCRMVPFEGDRALSEWQNTFGGRAVGKWFHNLSRGALDVRPRGLILDGLPADRDRHVECRGDRQELRPLCIFESMTPYW